MKSILRFFTILFFSLISKSITADNFSDKYGIGIIKIECSTKNYYEKDFYRIDLYDTLCDTIAAAKIYMAHYRTPKYDSLEKDINYLGFNLYGNLAVICIEKRKDWFKIRIKANKEYWVRNSEIDWPRPYGKKDKSVLQFIFITWSQFIVKVNWVDRNNALTNPIRKKPDNSGKLIPFNTYECLGPVESKGFWLKITPQDGEDCFEDPNASGDEYYQKKYFKYGWIKWRDENDFLIVVRWIN